MTISAPINMTTFQNAIYDWYYGATGLTTVWADQSVPRPDYPYASLNIISGPLNASNIWEQRHNYQAGRPAGEELEFTSCVPCTFVIGTQAYVAVPESRAPATSSNQYASRALAALQVPTTRVNLRDAGIAVVNQATLLNIDEVIDDAYVSRTGLDVTFSTVLNAVSYETYIESVGISSTPLGIDMTVPPS